MSKCCCYGCEKRHRSCWSECEEYKAWKAELQGIGQARGKYRHVDAFHAEAVQKLKKRTEN